MASLSTCPPLTRDEVIQARQLIRSHIHLTPVLTNKTLSRMASTPRDPATIGGRTPARPTIRLWFKCENMQRTGAFKARGAFHAIKRLQQEPGWLESGGKEKGVVGHSAGNHAQALALAAAEDGITSRIVMPTTTRPNKIAATKGYGAIVVFSGPGFAGREAVAAEIVAETGARLVPPHDHPDVILGQATAGLEFQEQVLEQQQQQNSIEEGGGRRKGLDAIIAPCSGGGLLSGTALSCEGTGIKVFGAEPEFEGADDGRRGFYSGARITAHNQTPNTVADGLAGAVSATPWGLIYERGLVRGMYAVTEEEILSATRLLLERLKMWVEPSAAVPLAVALYNEEFRGVVEREGGVEGWDLGLVVSGGNVDVDGVVRLFS
ncbi:pyridoxal-phosphate dependent enzyme [Colletotrichum scovillei]|uniref:Threonine dehydratase n=1 Tax=Colletotrichum scovillei TaxID=1209932 RepID=A0A9P7UL12_9PEZI|nr:pyridoxal-phosphate dependent enzyme [Colletotrichum scovillei]KAF4777633.1 pyridoxal-phosphate dependent enzyme [Colletotrichum scovillei]KAG7058853.1 threonine dehydratase [Colletotrichum scovillei]KAG7077429.1 threonine dehydratase [Colletotrichum scovillei]KAG7084589.1 threonine dehydratase [Colletotrichum scovillei]